MEELGELIALMVVGIATYFVRRLVIAFEQKTRVDVAEKWEQRIDRVVELAVRVALQTNRRSKIADDKKEEVIVESAMPILSDALAHDGLDVNNFNLRGLLESKLQLLVKKEGGV